MLSLQASGPSMLLRTCKLAASYIISLETPKINTLNCQFIPGIAAATTTARLRNHLLGPRSYAKEYAYLILPVIHSIGPKIVPNLLHLKCKGKGLGSVNGVPTSVQAVMENMLASSCGIFSS